MFLVTLICANGDVQFSADSLTQLRDELSAIEWDKIIRVIVTPKRPTTEKAN